MAQPTIKLKGKIKPLKDTVLVTDMEKGIGKTAGGIIIPDDDMKDRGIRSRWCRVFAVGPEVEDLSPGDWILCEHGRWTRGHDIELATGEKIYLQKVEYPEGILLKSDKDPRLAKGKKL